MREGCWVLLAALSNFLARAKRLLGRWNWKMGRTLLDNGGTLLALSAQKVRIWSNAPGSGLGRPGAGIFFSRGNETVTRCSSQGISSYRVQFLSLAERRLMRTKRSCAPLRWRTILCEVSSAETLLRSSMSGNILSIDHRTSGPATVGEGAGYTYLSALSTFL